jgi:hypothetical protein
LRAAAFPAPPADAFAKAFNVAHLHRLAGGAKHGDYLAWIVVYRLVVFDPHAFSYVLGAINVSHPITPNQPLTALRSKIEGRVAGKRYPFARSARTGK